jgi:hypothetical protein
MKTIVVAIGHDEREGQYRLDLVVNAEMCRCTARVEEDLLDGQPLYVANGDQNMIDALGAQTWLLSRVLMLILRIHQGELITFPVEIDDDWEAL